jgi:putative hydrolase of the HAD superfamily
VRNTEATEDNARGSLAAVHRPASAAGRAAELDAVTVDAMGTLVELEAPVERLAEALQAWEVERSHEEVAEAFRTEVAFYLEHKLSARDEQGLADLRQECSRVFLESAGAEIDPAAFSPAFVGAMVFEPVPGAVAAIECLRSAGLALACVSDWDIGLEEQLEKAGIDHLFDLILTSAEVGAPKPDRAIFEETLRRLAVPARRALHVGDGDSDRAGASATGMRFEPVPLATVPERLGLR